MEVPLDFCNIAGYRKKLFNILSARLKFPHDVSIQWSVFSGQWSVVSNQWSVISGQYSVFSGQ